MVIWVAMSSAPTGFIKANGAAVSRTTYSALFAAIGTTFGSGDGSTTFNVPDLRGEFVRGWDDGRGVDSGRSFGSSQTDAITDHTHKVRSEGQSSDDGANLRNTDGDNNAPTRTGGFNNYVTGVDALISGSSTTVGTETRPRNVALLACIKT
jgi:phage-related tail fiber protein